MVYWHVDRSVITPQNPHIITDSLQFPDGLLTCGAVCDHIPEPMHAYWLIALPWRFTDMWSGLWSHPGTHACLLTHCPSLMVYWHVERSVITSRNPCMLTDSLPFPDGLLTCGAVCDHIPEPMHAYWLIALPWRFTDMWSGLWSHPGAHPYLRTHCTSLTVYWHVEQSVITPQNPHVKIHKHPEYQA